MDKEYLNSMLERYFTRLEQVGYVPYNQVNNMLILLFIYEDILPYIEGDDKYTINKALTCIMGDCITPYSSCKKSCNQ